MLLAALSLGPRWVELLVDDPDAFDLLREHGGEPASRETLEADVLAEVSAFHDERSIIAALARIRRRHLLRIAYDEVVAWQPLPTVLAQLSDLADALIEAALAAAVKKAVDHRPSARRGTLPSSRIAVLALGPLGGREVSYDLPLELLFAYDAAPAGA